MSITHSQTITKLMGAMLKVQGDVEGVEKTKVNPAFKNKYATLENVFDTIREPCQAVGLVVMQAPGEMVNGAITITTLISHAESGEWIQSTAQLPIAKQDPQGAGSAITYGLRYSLMAMFALPPVDDDGEAAVRPAPRQQAAPQQREGAVDRVLAAVTAMKQSAKTFDDLRAWYSKPAVKQRLGDFTPAQLADFNKYYSEYQVELAP